MRPAKLKQPSEYIFICIHALKYFSENDLSEIWCHTSENLNKKWDKRGFFSFTLFPQKISLIQEQKAKQNMKIKHVSNFKRDIMMIKSH